MCWMGGIFKSLAGGKAKWGIWPQDGRGIKPSGRHAYSTIQCSTSIIKNKFGFHED